MQKQLGTRVVLTTFLMAQSGTPGRGLQRGRVAEWLGRRT